jgi:GT2 family glycosyltransferase
MIKVYVIIVTYNGAKWIANCIGETKKSTLPVTFVVVDNGSTDDTLSILASQYPEVKLIVNKENVGFGSANNVGIKYAYNLGADYVFLLNQDAWVLPQTIETLINIHHNHPQYYILSPVHLAGSGEQLDYQFRKWVSTIKPGLSAGHNLSHELPHDIYPVPFVNAALWLLSRECIARIGGFDPVFFHYGEDVDYVNRITYHGYKVGVSFKAIGVHDRVQPVTNGTKPSQPNKKRNTAYLILLKNINRSFPYSVMQFCNKLTKDFFSQLRRRRLDEAWSTLRTGGHTFLKLPEINKRRAASKTGELSFLD